MIRLMKHLSSTSLIVNTLHLRRTIMVLNNYIDNHLTDYEQPLTKKDFDDLKTMTAERELKDTFAHKMIRKLLPKSVKCIDSMKP